MRSERGIFIAVAILPDSNFFQFCYDCGCYSYHFSLTLQIFKHFRMLGPHRKFEVHTSFSCRDIANDAHKFSTILRHYPYAKALARLLGRIVSAYFYFDAFPPPLNNLIDCRLASSCLNSKTKKLPMR